MNRIVLGLQYDGAPWQGWQTQPHGQTVQDRLEQALAQFAQSPVATTCAGRTDTGVHALEQVVHFDTELERATDAWMLGTNRYLPPSIVVRWAHALAVPEPAPAGARAADVDGLTATDVDGAAADGDAAAETAPQDSEFHARFSAYARTYRYVLYNHAIRSPLLAGKAGWAHRPLDVARMREAAQCLVGTHDFSAFRSSQCQAKTPVKLMYAVEIEQRGELIIFTLRASAFLHHMVRNIVGSLVYVGSGRQPAAWLQEILEAGDRSLAAPTFMPDGLYLAKIAYDVKWQLPYQQEELSLPWLAA